MKKDSRFLVLKSAYTSGVAPLEPIENVPNKQDLRFGVSRAKGFPEDASLRMNGDFPKDVGLADAFVNTGSLLVVSDRLKSAFESISGALFENEVLPVKIVNHKKRVEKAPYFVIHQINHPACLDEKASLGTRMAINPKRFQFLTKMVVDEKMVDERKMIFRVAQFPAAPLIRRELADKLAVGEYTGLEFHEIEGFDFVVP